MMMSVAIDKDEVLKCPFGNEIFEEDPIVQLFDHLVDNHHKEMINYWINNATTGWGFNEPITKKRVVRNFAVDLIETEPEDVECPFCDYQPPMFAETPNGETFRTDVWHETLNHIGEKHWKEFLDWTEKHHQFAMEEEAFDFIMKSKSIEVEKTNKKM